MRKLFVMALAAAMICGCERVEMISDQDAPSESVNTKESKKFTFTVKGAFGDPMFVEGSTRGYLSSDGNTMTDLWVFDCVDGVCVQSVHQVPTDQEWGRPVMSLAYGDHHVYFVASRGVSPVLNEAAHNITWTAPRDTYWKDYSVSVVATSNGNRAVTLDRVVAKLKLGLTDAVQEGCALLRVSMGKWFYGLDFVSGNPVAESSNASSTVAVPSSLIGTTGVNISVYTFSAAEQWSSSVTLSALDANGATVSEASIGDVPMKRNVSTEYDGPLFGSAGSVGVSINEDWDDVLTGQW